jgi:hypothetical protein
MHVWQQFPMLFRGTFRELQRLRLAPCNFDGRHRLISRALNEGEAGGGEPNDVSRCPLGICLFRAAPESAILAPARPPK